MPSSTLPGGTFTLADDLTLTRMGYGAMQLAGPNVSGPPKDHDEAIAVLKTVVELGITHIDTSDFYGPHVTNQLIKEALHPYPKTLKIVTKVGAFRGSDGKLTMAQHPDELERGVHDNLQTLRVDALDVVNLRVVGHGHGPSEESITERFNALAKLQRQGLIRHLGLSNVTAAQVQEASGIAPVVCVQNLYNIANRQDDALIDSLAEQSIAYVPYFPLGGFSPLQSETLNAVAERLNATQMSVALAWLLQRSPNILLIPGTSSVAHLQENVAGAGLSLPEDALQALNAIAG